MELYYNQINTLEFSYKFLLSSYNYISCVWEPTIEKVFKTAILRALRDRYMSRIFQHLVFLQIHKLN